MISQQTQEEGESICRTSAPVLKLLEMERAGRAPFRCPGRQAPQDGVELQPRRERLTPTQLKLTAVQQQEARELVKSGVSLRQTAKQYGISRCALETILNDGKTSPREPRPTGPKLTPEQQQEAYDLVRAGVSLRQSAKLFGINHHTLIRYLRKSEESGSEEEDT